MIGCEIDRDCGCDSFLTYDWSAYRNSDAARLLASKTAVASHPSISRAARGVAAKNAEYRSALPTPTRRYAWNNDAAPAPAHAEPASDGVTRLDDELLVPAKPFGFLAAALNEYEPARPEVHRSRVRPDPRRSLLARVSFRGESLLRGEPVRGA